MTCTPNPGPLAPSPSGRQRWSRTVTRLGGFLDAEAEAGRAHLLTAGAVTYALVWALIDCGIVPSSIELHDHQPPDDAVCTLVIGPTTATTLAGLVYLPDQPGRPRVAVDRIARILYNVAGPDVNDLVVIFSAGPAATRQLRTHLPQFLDVPPQRSFTVRFQNMLRSVTPGAVPDDLEVTVLGRVRHQLPGVVVAAAITKRR